MQQKVELTLEELTKLVGDNAQVKEPQKTPAISKEDYLRLANLKIDKIFKPRIQKLENRVAALKVEYINKYPESKIQEYAVSEAEKNAKPIIKTMCEASVKFVNLVEDFRKWFPYTAISQIELRNSLTVVQVCSLDPKKTTMMYYIMFTIGSQSYKTQTYTIDKPERLKIIEASAAGLTSNLDKAKDALEILCKCYTKAKIDVVAEVEEGILESMIGKNKEASDLADEINTRLSSVSNQYLLNE